MSSHHRSQHKKITFTTIQLVRDGRIFSNKYGIVSSPFYCTFFFLFVYTASWVKLLGVRTIDDRIDTLSVVDFKLKKKKVALECKRGICIVFLYGKLGICVLILLF